jgi:hypothetical protein
MHNTLLRSSFPRTQLKIIESFFPRSDSTKCLMHSGIIILMHDFLSHANHSKPHAHRSIRGRLLIRERNSIASLFPHTLNGLPRPSRQGGSIYIRFNGEWVFVGLPTICSDMKKMVKKNIFGDKVY